MMIRVTFWIILFAFLGSASAMAQSNNAADGNSTLSVALQSVAQRIVQTRSQDGFGYAGIEQAAEGNSFVNLALGNLPSGDMALFADTLTTAKRRYNTASRLLRRAVENDAHEREIDASLLSSSPIVTTELSSQADVLAEIIAQVEIQSEAIDEILAG